MAAGALSVSNTIGAAITNRRVLGPAEAKIMVCASLVLLTIAALATLWPLLLVVPLTLCAVWLAIALLIQAIGCIALPTVILTTQHMVLTIPDDPIV